MTTNKLVWRQRWLDQCYSGSIATAGGLVFVGRNDGRLTALDSDSGRKLWEFQTGAGMNATASTFEHKGKQYVVAYSAGNVLVGTTHGDSVWLFALDGTLPPAAEHEVNPAAVTAAPAAASNGPALAAITSGKQLFEQVCAPCHGSDGKGGHGGGMPLLNAKEMAFVTETVTYGRNSMPPFVNQLSAEQIRAVGSYIVNDLFR